MLEGSRPGGTIENRAAFLQVKGTLRHAGGEFLASRQGAFSNTYLLESSGGVEVARAVRKFSLGEQYEVSFSGRRIVIRKKVLAMKDTFILSDDSGERGLIAQERLATRRLVCELDGGQDDLPREILLFLFWLAIIIRRRDASAG